jgi:hypothetical protein
VLSIPIELGGGSKHIPLPAGTYSVTTNLAHLGAIQPSLFTVPEGASSEVSFVWPMAS